jgi:hypothetical protein
MMLALMILVAVNKVVNTLLSLVMITMNVPKMTATPIMDAASIVSFVTIMINVHMIAAARKLDAVMKI